MKIAAGLIRVVWWLALSYLPIAIYRVTKRLYTEIGCPPQGECYLAGWLAGFEFELLAFMAAVGIWPVAVWFLGGGKAFHILASKLRPNVAVKRDAPQAARPLP